MFKKFLTVGLLLAFVATITPSTVFARGFSGGGGRSFSGGGHSFSGGRSFSSSSFSARSYTNSVRMAPTSKTFSFFGFGRPRSTVTTVKTNPFTGSKKIITTKQVGNKTIVTKTIIKTPKPNRPVIVNRPTRYYHGGHYYNSYSGNGIPFWYWYYIGMRPHAGMYVDGYSLERANCNKIRDKYARKACIKDQRRRIFY